MFLTILTRAYKRPFMLEVNRRSLEAQTCQSFEQIILRDETGIGIPAANVLFRTQDCNGDYCWVFDDDEDITDITFIEQIKTLAQLHNPEVIVAPSERGEEGYIGINSEMKRGNIGGGNLIVRKDIWMKYRSAWGNQYAGDWDFLKAMIDGGVKFLRFKDLMLKAQRVSRGAAE